MRACQDWNNGTAPNKVACQETVLGETAERIEGKQEMDYEYVTRDTQMPAWIVCPIFLLEKEISSTAKLLYLRVLNKVLEEDREEEHGYLFTEFPIREQAQSLSKSSATVKRALRELEQEGLLERRRQGFGKPNRLYVLIGSVK